MKDIDGDKIRMEIDKAMKEVDMEKIKQEAKESISRTDWNKMKKELEDVKHMNLDKLNTDMKRMEEELKKTGPQIEKEMARVKIEMEKARIEMTAYKEFTDGLEKDGLITKKEGYTIQHKNGELIVNGKTVTAEFYNKYRPFLEKHKTFNIKKSDDDFTINID